MGSGAGLRVCVLVRVTARANARASVSAGPLIAPCHAPETVGTSGCNVVDAVKLLVGAVFRQAVR